MNHQVYTPIGQINGNAATAETNANFLPKGFLLCTAIAVDQKSSAITNTTAIRTKVSGSCSGRLKFRAMIQGEASNPNVKKLPRAP